MGSVDGIDDEVDNENIDGEGCTEQIGVRLNICCSMEKIAMECNQPGGGPT